MSGDSSKIELYLKWDKNEKTRSEVQALYDKKDWKELDARFSERLSFGTAGLRGPMRGGFNGMNDLVIIQTTQGLSEYIVRQFPGKEDHRRGVVIGYDGRHNSKQFARLSACVLINKGIKVWLFSKMVPTPLVPYTVLNKKCLAGIVVTASHNPKEDNGYKLYWANGPQIIPPHDERIEELIEQNLVPLDSSWETSDLDKNELCEDPYDDMTRRYYNDLGDNIHSEFKNSNKTSDLRFVYTAMHGVGYPFVEEAFKAADLKAALVAVPEQQYPDPDFPTVRFPNPEEGKSSLELSIKKAEAENISIILANDPDADRLACAEKGEKGEWKVFNGNELGALLGWWAIHNWKTQNPQGDLTKCYTIASTVSSKILKSMGAIEGFHFVETLTGFKWMGNRAIELMDAGNTVLFAFEEAIGFMVCTTVLDKDGVSAAAHLATMASYLKATYNITLTQKLNEIYEKYGHHITKCSYFICKDPQKIRSIFNKIRNHNNEPVTYPTSILNGKFKIQFVRDPTTGVDTSQPDGKCELPTSSKSEMITFTFEEGLVFTLRASGTEPKIKYYAEMIAKPGEKDLNKLQHCMDEMVRAIVDEFLDPQSNNLEPKKD